MLGAAMLCMAAATAAPVKIEITDDTSSVLSRSALATSGEYMDFDLTVRSGGNLNIGPDQYYFIHSLTVESGGTVTISKDHWNWIKAPIKTKGSIYLMPGAKIKVEWDRNWYDLMGYNFILFAFEIDNGEYEPRDFYNYGAELSTTDDSPAGRWKLGYTLYRSHVANFYFIVDSISR